MSILAIYLRVKCHLHDLPKILVVSFYVEPFASFLRESLSRYSEIVAVVPFLSSSQSTTEQNPLPGFIFQTTLHKASVNYLSFVTL